MSIRTSARFVAFARLAIITLILVSGSVAAQAQTCTPALPPPDIAIYEPEVCPGATSYAGIYQPPEGINYVAYEWSIGNGTFPDGNTSNFVTFTSDGGGPIELTLTVTDDRGCQSTSSATIPLRSIPPPEIAIYEPAVCPGGTSYVSYYQPAEGINYVSTVWSIVNGTLPEGNTTGTFTADGTGPVQLTLTVTDTGGCVSSSTATIPLRSIPPPEIAIYEPAVCPGGTSYVSYYQPPEGINYVSTVWSIVNGTLPNGNTSGEFTADGTGPVQLTLTVTDTGGCVSSSTATIPLRSIPPPEIALYQPTVCAGALAYATYYQPPAGINYISTVWSIVNGTLPNGNASGTFIADGSGPVQLTLTVEDTGGCMSSSTVTVPLTAITLPPIVIQNTTVCPTETNYASMDASYSNYNWSVANGTIVSGQGTSQIEFVGDGSGAITVSVTASDSQDCNGTSSRVLEFYGVPIPLYAPSTACPGGLQKAVASSFSGESNYSWTATNATIEGSTTQSELLFRPDGSGPVTLAVTALTYTGCPTSNSVVIPLGPMPAPEIQFNIESICPYGSANAFVYGGGGDFYPTYNWEVTNATIIGYPGTGIVSFEHTPGTGDVTVTLSVGEGSCAATATRVLPLRESVEAIVELASPTVCQNGTGTVYIDNYDSFSHVGIYTTNGTVTSIGAGRVAGGRTITFQSNGAGDVSIDIYPDSNACPQRKLLIATMLPASATISSSGPTTFCQGGSVTLTASSGASYLWSNGATTPSITVSSNGAFSVTVTSAAGCARTSSPVTVTTTVNPVPGIHSAQIYDDPGTGTVVRNGDIIEACGNPTVRLIPLALNASYSYSWSTGATTAILDVTTSGTYTVTVTSPSGCTTISSVTVNYGAFPAKPTIGAAETELCPAGGSITLTAPTADGWTWSNGATTQSIIVNEPGSYTVRVRSGACDSELSDPIVITTGISTITTSDSLALCGPGSSATLTANDGTAWLWSNGATTRSIVVTQPGTYSVTTTNNGCTMPESSPVMVTARSVSVDADGPTTFCSGNNVTLTANGGTSWLWSNGATTQSVTVYASGDYGVTATYADGCVLAASPVSVEVRQVTVSVTADRTTVCTNGAIELEASASGGSGYTYQWFDDTYTPIAGATSSTLTITPSVSGFVYVKVLDALGCDVTSGGTTYTVLPTPDATITAAAAICEGQIGSASVADGGAGTAYSWTITNGTLNFPNASSVTFNASGLDPVTLTVTVTNDGCSVTSSKIVTVNPLPAATISASGATTFCDGGSVTLTASAGASYSWSNGATTQSIVVNASGNYSVTVMNAEGCSATSSATTVTVNALPSTTITPSGPTTFCVGSSVTLTASAGASYLWSNGATTQSIIVTTGDNYSVVVTNAEGCSATSSATTVTVNALPTATITPSGPTTFCIGGSVTLTASVGASYLWSTGATTQSINVTSGGNYTVTVTGAAGCSAMSAATPVVVNANPGTPTITASGPTTFCPGGSVTLAAPAGFTYAWSNGATTQSIVVNATNNYTVTVTNASGCSAISAPKSVTVNAATSISQNPQSKTIPRNTTTTLTVTASGTGTLTYQWYRGTSPSTATPISGATGSNYTTPKLNKGTYTYWVRVTGTCGVANSTTATVIAN